MYTFTCAMCGKEFESKAAHAKYCPDCRMKAQIIRNQRYVERKAIGTSVTVGSEKVCPICGETFILTNGNQKCCKNCTRKMNNKRKSVTNQKYTNSHYDVVTFRFPKGQREVLKQYASERDMSVNKLLLTALEEYFEKHGKPITETESDVTK